MPLVYHVLPDKSVGGAERVVLSLAKHTEGGAFRSHILLPEGSLLIPLLQRADISYSEYKEASASFSLLAFFYRFFRKHPPDVLVTHGCFLPRFAGRFAGKFPLISFKHCALPMRVSPTLYRTFTDASIAVSENANNCLQKLGVSSQKRKVIPNGFRFIGAPNAEMRAKARAKLGISGKTIAIGISARLSSVKGHETAFRAIAALPNRFSLYLMGDGEEKERLNSIAQRLGIEKRVRFLGFCENTDDFYHALDAHLSCSLASETASLSLAEGMSAGCPTFASDIEGNLDRVKDGGVFFSPTDAAALAAHLLRLENEAYKTELRLRALKRAKELPSEEDAKKTFESFLLSFCR